MTTSSEEYAAAQLELDTAIRTFYDKTIPGTYVEGWVLTVDRTALTPDCDVPDSLNYVVSPGLRWVHRRGMMHIAYHSALKSDDQDHADF